MHKLFTVELVFVLLILFVRKGQSIKCYQCRSDVQTGCEEKVDTSNVVDCPERQNASGAFCRKINQKLKFKNEENWTVIRECAYEKGSEECYYFKWVNLGYQEICECAEEGCNGASNHIPNIVVVSVIFFIIGIFNYLNSDNT